MRARKPNLFNALHLLSFEHYVCRLLGRTVFENFAAHDTLGDELYSPFIKSKRVAKDIDMAGLGDVW